MSRTIEISTDVFAAIWAARQKDENTEDEILQRLLSLNQNPTPGELGPTAQLTNAINGYFDSRNDVHFPEGFTIFRMYKGEIFTAIATRGEWMLAGTNFRFRSLNKLNEHIVNGSENIWNGNWTYVDTDQKSYSIDRIRKKKSERICSGLPFQKGGSD